MRATAATPAEGFLEERHVGAQALAIEGGSGVAPGAPVVVDEGGDGGVGSARVVELAHATSGSDLDSVEPGAH